MRKRRISKFVTKPVRLPLNWLVSRHAVDATKEFKFKSNRYPVCPNCSLSRFELLDEGVAIQTDDSNNEKPRPALWGCPSCAFQVKTKFSNIKDIQDWCVKNARTVYENSGYQREARQSFLKSKSDNASLDQLSNSYLMLLAGYYISIVLLGAAVLRFVYSLMAFVIQRQMIYWVIGSPLLIAAIFGVVVALNYLMWQSPANKGKLEKKQSFLDWYETHKILTLPSFEVSHQSSIRKSIKVYMLGCYCVLVIAAVMGLAFVYASYNLIFLYMVNTLLFMLAALFVALVFNYRAWQAYSDNIYTKDAKALFQWWIKSHPWYTQPKDIGQPPPSNTNS